MVKSRLEDKLEDIKDDDIKDFCGGYLCTRYGPHDYNLVCTVPNEECSARVIMETRFGKLNICSIPKWGNEYAEERKIVTDRYWREWLARRLTENSPL